MDSHTSFCLNPNSKPKPNPNPNPNPSASVGSMFIWESHIWPFADCGKGDEKVIKPEKTSKGKGKRKAEVDVETHIYTERERRKKMRNMFSSLHAMLPQLPPKIDKTSIVDEAVKEIKALEIQVEKLREEKENRRRCSTNASIAFEPSSVSLKQAARGQITRESFLADHGAAQAKTDVSSSSPAAPLMFHTWTSPNVVLNTFGNEAQITICSPRKLGLLTAIVLLFEKNMIEVESANASTFGRGNFYMFHVRLADGAIGHSPMSFSADGVFKEAIREMMPLFPFN